VEAAGLKTAAASALRKPVAENRKLRFERAQAWPSGKERSMTAASLWQALKNIVTLGAARKKK
jgi:hypothetical protein